MDFSGKLCIFAVDMKKMRRIYTLFICLLAAVALGAQPLCQVVQYDEEDGVASSHVTQLAQDEKGFMWFATWNGLCRYDGYDFQTFKPRVGDGCHMTTDRIRNISLLPEGRILCQTDEGSFMFELSNYRFRDLTSEEQDMTQEWTDKYRQSRSLKNREYYEWKDAHQTLWRLYHDGRLTYMQDGQEVSYPLERQFNTLTFATTDNRGNLWVLDYSSIYKFCTDRQRTQRLDIVPKAEVKCLFSDQEGRYWVTTKDDEAVRIFGDGSTDHSRLATTDRENRPLYLGSDGRLHQQYTRFGAAVYCIHQSKDGTLWLGTKPQGIYRLQPTGAGSYKIAHFTDIPQKDVYHITEDRYGRLWVATLGGGIFYTSEPQSEKPTFKTPRHYPMKECPRARYFYMSGETMLVATSSGLLIAKILPDADKMQFLLHQREADRKESLSCSATMNVVQDQQGRLFVSTESGGVNQLMSNDLLAPQLTFQPLTTQLSPLTSDVVQSLATTEKGGLMVVGSHLLTIMDSTLHGRVMDASDFHADYRFSEAQPIALKDGQWLFGLMDGAFMMSEKEMLRETYSPKLVLTKIEVRGKKEEGRELWGAERLDTLTLEPQERNATIHFAALDFNGAERISYAFRLSDKDDWSYIGHDRSATLLDLKPGTYLMEIRSTNVDGEWLNNTRQLTIIVKPTFWEAWYGQLLLLLLIIGVVAIVVYTLLYIRRIKRQQRETLEKYLALLEEDHSQQPRTDSQEPTTTDPMLQRIIQFIEENIGNSDVGVGDMAEAAATSRSGLQRKLKQTMGVTPQELLSEARIKRACQLLRQTDRNISEVAYACGFNDPKYFSRCFKQSTGKTPKEYREES